MIVTRPCALTGFHWMKSIIPTYIPHQLEKEMALQSQIFLLPVLLNNEACYSDCVLYRLWMKQWSIAIVIQSNEPEIDVLSYYL